MRSNAVAWNPQEPMNFVCANEDTNLYTFDLRNLNQVSVKSVSVKSVSGPRANSRRLCALGGHCFNSSDNAILSRFGARALRARLTGPQLQIRKEDVSFGLPYVWLVLTRLHPPTFASQRDGMKAGFTQQNAGSFFLDELPQNLPHTLTSTPPTPTITPPQPSKPTSQAVIIHRDHVSPTLTTNRQKLLMR